MASEWKDWGNPWKTSVRIIRVPAEIQTDNLYDTSQEGYRYANSIFCKIQLHG
jgi:hypothetical protein